MNGEILDRYCRFVASRSCDSDDGAFRTCHSREGGQALRRRSGAAVMHEASHQPAPADLVSPEPVALPSVPRIAGLITRTRVACIRTSVETVAATELSHEQTLVVTVSALPTQLGRIAVVRLSRQFDDARFSADIELVSQIEQLARCADEVPRGASIFLAPEVAATLLALGFHAPLVANFALPGLNIVDNATVAGGPLGTPFDAAGEPTRVLPLSGSERIEVNELPWQRPSFTDLPRRAPINLQLMAPAPARPTESEFTALGIVVDRGKPLRLIGDRDGRPAWMPWPHDLKTLLHAVVAVGPDKAWVPGFGAVGSSWLMIDGARLAPSA